MTATPEQIDKAVDEFLNGKDTPGPTGGENATKPDDGSSGGVRRLQGQGEAEDPTDGANVIPTSDVLDPETGINKFDAFGKTSARRLDFPIWIPTAVVPGSAYSEDSRQYDIKDEDDKKQPAYKLVIEYTAPDRLPEYYGVQGTTWSDPPILQDPAETRRRSTAATTTSTTTATGSAWSPGTTRRATPTGSATRSSRPRQVGHARDRRQSMKEIK